MNEPERDEHRDRGREHARERCGTVRGQPDEERAAAAEPVAERAGEQLTDGETGDARSQRQLPLPRARVEVTGELGQPRQVEIDRKRAEGRQRAQDDDEPGPTKHGYGRLPLASLGA